MKRKIKIIMICTLALLLLMTSTEPAKLPAGLLVIPFLLLFIIFAVGLIFLLELQGVEKTKSRKIGLSVGSLPVVLLVLQSLGQLTFKDVFTIGALFTVAYFYISRATRQTSNNNRRV